MDDKKVARINELYHKSKSEGLTPEEPAWAVEQHFYKGKRRKYYEFR